MEYKEILDSEIKKLKKVINQLADTNIFSCNTKSSKTKEQGKLNRAYSTMVDIKTDLEIIVKEMEKNEISKM